MKGETVTVSTRTQTGVDDGNNPTWEWADETVENVLVGPPSGSNGPDSSRPDGITVDLNLYFPRSWVFHSLRGAKVLIRGNPVPYYVVGDPLPVDGGMTPTQWNLTVPVSHTEG